MNVSKIFREAQSQVAAEIKELKERHRQQIQKKDETIKKLKQRIAELSPPPKATATGKLTKADKEFLISSEGLRQLRTQRDLTQMQIARLLGISHPAYCAWENGRNAPRESSVKRIVAFSKLSDAAFLKKFTKAFPDAPISEKP